MFNNIINANFRQSIFNNIITFFLKKTEHLHFLLRDVPALYHIFTFSYEICCVSNLQLLRYIVPQEKKSRFGRDRPESDPINAFL